VSPTLLTQYGCGPIHFTEADTGLYDRHLLFDNVLDLSAAGPRERFEAFARSVRDVLSQRWVRTEQTYERQNPKRVYYLSMEFLIGRSLDNNVINLLLDPIARHAAALRGHRPARNAGSGTRRGLGNGGLGGWRRASSTHGHHADPGDGLRACATSTASSDSDRRRLASRAARQLATAGRTRGSRSACTRPSRSRSRSSIELRTGRCTSIPGRPSTLIGIPFDRPVVGYGGKTINTLRLWAAARPGLLRFPAVQQRRLRGRAGRDARRRVAHPRALPRRLHGHGQAPPLRAGVFSGGLFAGDLVRRFRRGNDDWAALPEKAAIQLNDTHPALAVPELMRILLDDAKLGWDQAWDLTRRTLAYTNHTLLPEALEKWPLDWFEPIIPRNLEIIYEINRRLLDEVRSATPATEQRVARMSLIEEGASARSAWPTSPSSARTARTAWRRSTRELLRTTTVRDFAEMFPEPLQQQDQRRDAAALAADVQPGARFDDHRRHRRRLDHGPQPARRTQAAREDKSFRDAFRNAKRQAKTQFADWIKATAGLTVDPDTIFDCQVKRIHEYKRQLLNALRIVVLYNRLRANPQLDIPAAHVLLRRQGRAGVPPGEGHHQVHQQPRRDDRRRSGRARAHQGRLPARLPRDAGRAPDSRQRRLQPDFDRRYEASGTSNMKFMMNGALTIGTRDGATIEMAQEAGEENFFLFGLSAEQVAGSRGWYSPWWHYTTSPRHGPRWT
jgi:starch phosphorylase